MRRSLELVEAYIPMIPNLFKYQFQLSFSGIENRLTVWMISKDIWSICRQILLLDAQVSYATVNWP